jgi:hypothetical protein
VLIHPNLLVVTPAAMGSGAKAFVSEGTSSPERLKISVNSARISRRGTIRHAFASARHTVARFMFLGDGHRLFGCEFQQFTF